MAGDRRREAASVARLCEAAGPTDCSSRPRMAKRITSSTSASVARSVVPEQTASAIDAGRPRPRADEDFEFQAADAQIAVQRRVVQCLGRGAVAGGRPGHQVDVFAQAVRGTVGQRAAGRHRRCRARMRRAPERPARSRPVWIGWGLKREPFAYHSQRSAQHPQDEGLWLAIDFSGSLQAQAQPLPGGVQIGRAV